MREHLTPANMVTSVSLTIGFLALLLAPRSVALVTVIVLLAAILDGIDGTLARRRGGDRTFGAQLDSMADLLCFCVVPAFAMHHAWPGGAWVPAVLAGCGFVLAGAWRLARFPLVQQQDRFVGLPTPAAGTLLMLLVLGTCRRGDARRHAAERPDGEHAAVSHTPHGSGSGRPQAPRAPPQALPVPGPVGGTAASPGPTGF